MSRPKLPKIKLLLTDTLTCRYCKQTKTVENFCKSSRLRIGYRKVCKVCHSKNESVRYQKSIRQKPEVREEINRRHRERYKNDPEYRQKFLESSKRNRRKCHLKIKYDLTENELKNMRDAQYNKCAICFNIFNETPCIDHNHINGKIRGLLCASCNLGLGKFKDDSEILLQAYQYLKRSEDET